MIRAIANRVANAFDRYVRLTAAGLSPWGENVNPRLKNDNYWALLSLYEFARRRWADRQKILDAGCGPGYGTAHLARDRRARVVGVDYDRLNIHFARRNYRQSDLEFFQKNVEQPFEYRDGEFDAIFSSNVLEHLERPERFLREMGRLLDVGGEFILAFPAIIDERSMELNRRIRFHRSNRYVSDWVVTLSGCFEEVEIWSHRERPGIDLDLSNSRRRTDRSLDDFVFNRSGIEEIEAGKTMTALFVLRRARR